MARAALNLGIRELAALCNLAPNTIVRFEKSSSGHIETVRSIVSALEAAGVEFIDENGGGAGVRLRKPSA